MNLKSCIIMVDFGNSGDDTNFSKLFVIDSILERELFVFTSSLDYKEMIKKQEQILMDKGVIKYDYDRSEIFLRVEKPVLHSVVYHINDLQEMQENLENITNHLI
jgi:hypothetical protein